MELAALPGHGGEDGGAGGAQAGVVIADRQLDAVQAALLQAAEEGAPMDLGFAQGDADAQDGAFAIRADAQGDEDGAIQHAGRLDGPFRNGRR